MRLTPKQMTCWCVKDYVNVCNVGFATLSRKFLQYKQLFPKRERGAVSLSFLRIVWRDQVVRQKGGNRDR